jgi:hypothetical protein
LRFGRGGKTSQHARDAELADIPQAGTTDATASKGRQNRSKYCTVTTAGCDNGGCDAPACFLATSV